ncbi:MAG: ATP-dependent Clp protease proteolytic subunit [Actinobacteria bacterium]|nr:MAG: ATP-dependent Clp protease proteolytic subunit [Actinomycetota bacterium]TMK83142.1 MAG: ATP-dependent Clp protease proteolytic subunit [Actinomycetota bacterium]
MIGQIIPLDPGARWPDRVEDAALSLLLRRRIVFLRGAIQENVAGDIAAQLLALDGISSEPITLIIDSPGGDVSGLFTLLDTMGILDATVDTKCVGMAASAASVILCAGTGVRSATPNARIMLHQPHGGIQGASAKDLEIAAKEFLFLKARLEEILSERTHQPLERIREDTDRDFWMSAAEAKDYGLIDRVDG